MNCCIGHDSCLGGYAHLAPGVRLGGNVDIGEESFLGLGAVVRPGIHIGQRVTVGAGAAVIHDLADDVVAVGVPAEIVRRNTRKEWADE
jgi:acetyltransferase-like isoleucine patch superfamily enzyme